jgi:hypothetical protein
MDTTERNVPFTPDEMETIKAIAKREGRAFKFQAQQLIREAIAARAADAAANA